MPPRVGLAEQTALGADSLLLAQLLWNRGLRSAADANRYLAPTEVPLADPFLLRGLDAAVDTVESALAAGDVVAIYGDYDTDGVAGAALLHQAIGLRAGNVRVHIPDRSRDGYGVHPQAIRDLAAAGARVLITVDCGISANEPIALARELGIQVIVTDHHVVPETLPSAAAVINPNQPGCLYPFKDLAGGGVAFHLARALLGRAFTGSAQADAIRRLTPFAALSTVGDIVSLQGDNRTLVATGIAELRLGHIPGIRALCTGASLDVGVTTARDLAFKLIPRLNAASRMGVARDALELLIASSDERALEVAGRLEEANGARRARMDELLVQAEARAEVQATAGAIVLAGDYPIGLAGLVASRLVDRFQVPGVVIEQGPDISRGSVRGAEGLHMVQALDSCSQWLLQYGGHERAAGFSLRTESIDAFRDAFVGAIQDQRGDAVPTRMVRADCTLRLESVGQRLADLIDRFEPLGAGNATPAFVSRRVEVRRADYVKGGHIRVQLTQGAAMCRGIAFRPSFELPAPGTTHDVVYEVERSVYLGEERVELLVRDLRVAE